ncbi:DUF2218 domain-containing protein [Methyloligella sp. 2.7D]|uniref:DUF2218 domain-containing protein n=1 Tax=unclassified Methyloligella TaxID=2625955 RepID=UPI00157CF401|nr:DUF2218 domain-containing protein [Methyloligella sp. GL2]QKP78143.1 DUF2218 domain-containing protein [Methyloligella sp. GL2]
MIKARTTVATPAASKYLQQLCKHFAHKAPATFDTKQGRVEFPFGLCELEARDNELAISCDSPDDLSMSKMQGVVGGHLERFAWREKLQVRWDQVHWDSGSDA